MAVILIQKMLVAFLLATTAVISAVSPLEGPFMWGTATASYQIEGAVKEDGRLPSVWDEFSHIPGKTANGDNGDVADDNYHRIDEDVALLTSMGLNAYRFSISWSRILPHGDDRVVNQAGIDHYNHVIDSLIKANITPLVTLFHWDTPLALEHKYEGWLSPSIEHDFAHYADVCFQHFGDRVKHWITLNEPLTVAFNGYCTGEHAPGRCSDRTKCTRGNSATEPYIAAHNMLNAHAAAVEVYRNKYQVKQDGVIGITLNTDFSYPMTNSTEDAAASERNHEFQASWFADPIFFGHYPESMVKSVGDRLPVFTEQQQRRIKGSHDFYGLNHYTTKWAVAAPFPAPGTSSGWIEDQGNVISNTDADGNLIGPQAESGWLNVVPSGLYNLLHWLDKRYNHPLILITENGVDAPGESSLPLEEALQDTFRINYYAGYLDSVMRAKAEGVDVRGYFAWALMDNFEWADGYTCRFGLHYVDYNNNQTRYPKNSVAWYSNFAKTHP